MEEESEERESDGPSTTGASVEEDKVKGGDNHGTSLVVVSLMVFLILLFSFIHRFVASFVHLFYFCNVFDNSCFIIIC